MQLRSSLQIGLICLSLIVSGSRAGEVTDPLRSKSLSLENTGASIVIRDSAGLVLREGRAGQDDGALLQWAIDAVQPDGSLQVGAGHYSLSRTLEISNPIALQGEGSPTVIAPPAGDFAFRLARKAGSHTRAEILRTAQGGGWDEVLTGISISNLAIDGGPEGIGKGIYLRDVGQSALKDLWILRTREGAAIDLAEHVIEVVFSRIHLLDNGNAKAKEASIVVASQESGDANNNIHFDNVFVIFPNYIGLEIGVGTGKMAPRLIFINQCMFHGWLGQNEAGVVHTIPAPFELIRVAHLGLGMVIRDSRFTNSGDKSAYIDVERGEVKILDNIIGGGRGGAFIKAGNDTRVTMTGNTFQPAANSDGSAGVVVEAEGAGVTFDDNTLVEGTGPIHFLNPIYAIVRGNVFVNKTEQQAIDIRGLSMRRVIVKDNVFLEK